MTCARVFHAEQGDDIASLGRGQLLARVGVHLNNSTNSLGLACERIENVVTFFQRTGIDARKRQCTKAIVHDFERQCSQRLVRIDDYNATRLVAFEVNFGLGFDFSRVRQVINHCIKYVLYPFVFKSSTAVRRKEFQRDRTLANATFEIVD